MSDARKAILDRLHRWQSAVNDAATHNFAAKPMNWDLNERISHFTLRLRAAHAEVKETSQAAWPDVLQGICQARAINNLLVSPATSWGKKIYNDAAWFPPLSDYQQPIESWKDGLFNGIDAAVTGAYAGIAETGTVILWPGEHEPRTMSLVPPVHIVIIERNAIYGTFTEVIQAQEWAGTGLPANVILISGPSKSADIEQTMTYGVHGPKQLIVIVV